MTRRALGACALFGSLMLGLLAAAVRLPMPELSSWAAADDWYRDVGPETAVIAGAVLVALALTSWLLIAAATQLVAAVVRGPFTTAAATMIAPRSLQGFVHGLAGASFAAGLVVTPPSAGLPPGGDEPGTATLELVVSPPTATSAPTESQAPPASAPADAPSTVTVSSGDSFWTIAERALRAARPAPEPEPSTREITDYWLQVIDANRGILVVPSDPDLLHRGQVVTLPVIPPGPPG